MTVSLLVGWRSTMKVGSSTASLPRMSNSRCSSPFFFVSTASPAIGPGKLERNRWMWSSSCESCSTLSNSDLIDFGDGADVAGQQLVDLPRSCPATGTGGRP